jgi:DNA replication protein DnaC
MEILKQLSQKIDEPMDGIGYNKYQILKSLPFATLTDLEKSQMEKFENKHLPSLEQREASKKYISDMLSQKEEKPFKTTALLLGNVFKTNFHSVNKKEFVKDEFTTNNILPLVYYFSKDKRFFDCENLSKLSTPSFDKGVLIVGTFGNGKTAAMRVFERIFQNIKGMTFKGYTANEVVGLFEKCSDDVLKKEFERKMNFGSRYFDDVKTERIASNYGKINIFKDILETRYNNNLKTYITCNYKEGFEGNVEVALEEFGEKYGGRVYDRLFEMFNVIEFKGKSFRK